MKNYNFNLIPVIKADGSAEYEFIEKLKKRNEEVSDNVIKSVTEIIKDVRINGDGAIKEYTKRFDGVDSDNFEISSDRIKEGFEHSLIKESLLKAAKNISEYHEKQKQSGYVYTKEKGVCIGQRVRGLHKVGIYVPGGTAAYPSSVLMNCIPAKLAGVKEIIMVTPPSKNGGVNDDILAAAYIAGVDRVFAVGGAQAVAGLAYGTKQLPKVDKIVGPGNIYVATAKRLLYGTVDIDMIAGPSEIMVIADEYADPSYLAADLMSQAEHDLLASCVLLCYSEDKAQNVINEIQKQLKTLSRSEIIKKALYDFSAIIICKDKEKAVEISNTVAPEHLELMVGNPFDYLNDIDNAGSVFLGSFAPEPLGDYFAGPNHVLPTSGTARFFSPLSVDSFIKKSSFIYYTKEALSGVKDDIIKIADAEGLTAHANSIKVRFEKNE
jgi:histidinol dehydrogenase